MNDDTQKQDTVAPKNKNVFLRLACSQITPSDEIPPFSSFMIKHKIARNEFQALFAIFVLIIVFVLLTINVLTISSRFYSANTAVISNDSDMIYDDLNTSKYPATP